MRREAWRLVQPALDAAKLIFIDETGFTTKMTRLYGRAPRGQRCLAAVPHGHWKTLTLVTGLRITGFDAPMTVAQPMNKAIFIEYTRQVLCPALAPGDVVVMDNLGSHKADEVREAIQAVGAELVLLPPYSPDFAPIEQAFSASKQRIRTQQPRTVKALEHAIAPMLDAFSAEQALRCFQHAGYRVY